MRPKLFTERHRLPGLRANDADAAGLAEMAFGVGRGITKGVVIMITVGTGIGTALFIDGILVPNTELGHIEIRGKDAERRASDAARQRKEMSWEKWARQVERVPSAGWRTCSGRICSSLAAG